MYRERKIYFSWLFSVFILFALLILFKKPMYIVDNDPYIWVLMSVAVIPGVLVFLKNKPINIRIAIAYLPAVIGFFMSLVLNNTVYFLVAFPIFLINFMVIFPRGRR